MNLEIGTELGDYRIVSRIGQGAYGIVYEAEHVITRRIDALKFLHDPGSVDDEQRFLQEIQSQARLHHPNIATVYTAFRTPWGLALAMEKVQGEPLSAVLKRCRLPLSEGVRFTLTTLSALSCAERFGIVHRDIKPDNILITPDGEVKITDFGLAQIRGRARITSSGESLGTPCYMAPEQVIGTNPVDARTDVYSTAVVLYEIVTGRPPFEGSNGFAVMLAHQNTPPPPPIEIEPAIGGKLNHAIMTALQKNPDLRFQSAAEFYQALTEAISSAPEPTLPLPLGVRRNAHARIAAVVAGVCMCLGGLIAWAARSSLQKSSAPAHAVAGIPAAPPPAPAPLPEAEIVPVVPGPPAPEPAAEPHATVARKARRRRARMEEAISHVPATTEPAAENHARVSESSPAVDAGNTVPPQEPPEPPHESPAPAAVQPQAASSDADGPKGKKPNVFRRAITRIFGRRDKHAVSTPVKPE